MKKNLPTAEALLVAIRAKCMDCSGNQRKEVERCKLKDCPLHPYRSVKAIGGEHECQTEIKVSPSRKNGHENLRKNRMNL